MHASDIADLVTRYETGGSMVERGGESFSQPLPVPAASIPVPAPVPSQQIAPRASQRRAIAPEQSARLDAGFVDHLETLMDGGENPLRRAFAAKQLIAPVRDMETMAHDGKQMKRQLSRATASDAEAGENEAEARNNLAAALGRIYRDPHSAERDLEVLIKRRGWEQVAAEVASTPEILGDMRGGMLVLRSERATAVNTARQLPLLLSARDKTLNQRRETDAALAHASGGAGTSAAQEAFGAMETLSLIGALFGLTSPMTAGHFMREAEGHALNMNQGDLADHAGLPEDFVERLGDQHRRVSDMRWLEEHLPEDSPLRASDAAASRRRANTAGPRATHSSHRLGAVDAVERFVRALEAEERNAGAAETLADAGHDRGAELASGWAERARLHMVDAAMAIKTDFGALKEANNRGLIPLVEQIISTATAVAEDSGRRRSTAQAQ